MKRQFINSNIYCYTNALHFMKKILKHQKPMKKIPYSLRIRMTQQKLRLRCMRERDV